MQSVGTRLREARIKKGYTLEDINTRTRISLKNLNAIESDDLDKMSSPFTYRSFVKQVADILGADFATLAPDVQVASSTMPEPLVPGQEEELFIRPHQFQQARPKRNLSWVSRTISIAAIVAAVSGYLIWRNGGIEAAKLPVFTRPAGSRVLTPPNRRIAEPIPNLQASTPPVLTPVVAKTQQPGYATGTEQLSPPQVPSETPTPPLPPEPRAERSTIHIELSAVERTWLSIASDGKTTYTGILEPMQTKVFDGRESARIRTANAGGVNVVFNGRALGSMGRRGQSRTFVFTKNGYEVVRGLSDAADRNPSGG
jgi:cytoskeleton protein RodZ